MVEREEASGIKVNKTKVITKTTKVVIRCHNKLFSYLKANS